MILRTAYELGQFIRDQRTSRRLTQAQLAEMTGVSRKWLIDLEGGKRATDLSLVLRTFNALGIELEARSRDVKVGANSIGHDIDDIVARSRKRRS